MPFVTSTIEVVGVEIPYFYITSKKDVLSYFSSIIKEKQGNPNFRLSIDLETYPRIPNPHGGLIPVLSKIRTLQAYDGKRVVILDFMKDKDGASSSYLLADKDFASKFYDYLLTANELIAHNALFETAHIQRVATAHNFWNCRLHIYCTMNMWRLFTASEIPDSKALGSSLAKVAKHLFKLDIDKEEQTGEWGRVGDLTPEQLSYCALDAVLPYYIFDELSPRLKDKGLWQVFELNTRAQEPVASMHLHGMTVDADKHAKLMQEWKEKSEEYEQKCFELLNAEVDLTKNELTALFLNKVAKKWHDKIIRTVNTFFEHDEVNLNSITHFKNILEAKVLVLKNTKDKEKKSKRTAYKRILKNIDEFLVKPSSSKQVGEWLEANVDEDILANWPTTEKTAQFKTDAEALKDHAEEAGLEALLHYKHYQKLYSTYGEGLKKFFIDIGPRTILCPNFSLCFTETGRMSSYAPAMQTIPRDSEIRSIFIPRSEDYKLLVADFSQIEVRLAAYWSKDKVFLQGYKDEIDVHTLTASRVAQKRPDNVTSDERQMAKNLNFCLLFGGGAGTLKAYAKRNYGIRITDTESEKLVNGFREAYPEFREWQLSQAKQAEKELEVRTKLGKIRALDPDYTYTVSMNMPIQGAAAEIMLQALVNVHTEIWKHGYDARIVNCVHDEIIVDCHQGHVEEMKKVIEDGMVKAMQDILELEAGHPLLNGLVQAGAGDSWSSAKQLLDETTLKG